jgi:hypothetical protein
MPLVEVEALRYQRISLLKRRLFGSRSIAFLVFRVFDVALPWLLRAPIPNMFVTGLIKEHEARRSGRRGAPLDGHHHVQLLLVTRITEPPAKYLRRAGPSVTRT